MKRSIIATGDWGEDASWQLYHNTVHPPLDLSTAVMCVAIIDDQIVLARSDRGWGILGGHIEEGEDHITALHREAHEEGGFRISNYQLFAVREITNKRPIALPGRRPYPFPTSYMTYYWATTDTLRGSHYGEEIIESNAFKIDAITPELTNDHAIIRAGWRAYQSNIRADS